jgi:Skp family chaperone for outer membrane proteins
MPPLSQLVARRGTELRCPACLRFKPSQGPCPVCGCGEIPLERHGAARMLLHAGVDRFALAQRVATLDHRQAEELERQYAAQWEMAWPLIEDVQRCEAHLLQNGFVEETLELLAEWIPMDPAQLAGEVGPPERPETLETLFSKSSSWHVRRMAALALMHQGRASPDIVSRVYSALLDEGGERTRVEAMIALTRWRVRSWVRIGAEGWKHVRELARKSLGHPELAPRVAVAWVHASRGEAPEVDVLFALRQGLSHPDLDVRFECALCLDDEKVIAEALDSPDPELVSEARKSLASRGSLPLFERLASEGGAAFASDVVGQLPREVPPEALEALLSVSERGPDRLTEALLALIGGRPFAEWPEEAQARWRTWARAVLREVPGEAALRFLRWAGEPPVSSEPVRAFVEGTAEALAREPADVRARNLGDVYFSRFLALASALEEPLLNQWARDPECGAPLAQALMTLTSRIQDWQEPKGQAARMLMAVWEGPDRQAVLKPLKQAVREWSGIVGRDELIDAVWQRFQQHPEERADLLFVFAPWRQELWERQLAAPEDAVARFKAWCWVDPEGFARQADLLMREAPTEDLPRRVRCVLAAMDDGVATQPRTASLAVFYAAAGLANAFRAGADELAPEAERFLEWFPHFEQRVRTAPPEEDERAPRRDFLEELHTEVRLMRERLDAMREDEDRKWQEEMRRQVEESRRRDLERQAREAERQAEEARRQAEELQRAAEEARRVMEAQQPPAVPLPFLRPRIASKPIDSEVIFPGKALPTLLDYVRLVKSLSLGDPLKAISSAGLDMPSWASEATAWGQAMVGRHELGLRFGELMTATWE